MQTFGYIKSRQIVFKKQNVCDNNLYHQHQCRPCRRYFVLKLVRIVDMYAVREEYFVFFEMSATQRYLLNWL